jgi:hypothetical protein
MTPSDFKALRKRYGTQADTADALGISLRTVKTCESPSAPLRPLYGYALVGLLLEAGKPVADLIQTS